MFQCKNGEKRPFMGVYFILRLTTNIVGLEKLEEAGYNIAIGSGVLKLREPSGQLLVKVKRGQTGCTCST